MNTIDNLELGKQQVVDFHVNIQTWFNGTAENKDELYQAIVSTFNPSFVMTNGDGKSMGYETFVQWLATAYGIFPTRQIEVKDIEGYATFSHVIVNYIEIQQTDELRTERESSAVFMIGEGQTMWYHLIEKWI